MDIFEQVAQMKYEEGYRKGLRQGLKELQQKRDRRVAENLLRRNDLLLNQIASVANVSLNFVKKVKRELKTK